MHNDLISIIIPAYNSEDTIADCLTSVINQTYNKLDIIVVNDGSTDKTSQVVSKFSNVKLYNKSNGGLCSARNFGLKFCTGKYIIFIDSDDFIEKDFVQNLYNYCDGKNNELVMCDFLLNGKKENESFGYLKLEGKEEIFNCFLHGGIYNRTVNKIYPSKMIKCVSFPEGRDMLEDAYFTSHILEFCDSVIRIPYAGYNYIRRINSLSKRKRDTVSSAGMYSNILEKDVIISKYISQNEYDFFSSLVLKHIINCLNGCKRLNLFDIEHKIITLISFFSSNVIYIENKKVLAFFRCMKNSHNEKTIRKNFMLYIIINHSIHDKFSYLKWLTKKIFKKL